MVQTVINIGTSRDNAVRHSKESWEQVQGFLYVIENIDILLGEDNE